MSNQEVRIGIVGAGANTRSRHIPGFKNIPNVKITAVANRTLESSKKAAKEFNIKNAYAHWEDVIDDPEVDAVCIGTWPYMHESITVAALDAGKHVLCEARMASTLEEALSMQAAAKQYSNLVCQLVPSPISLKADKQITAILGSGEIGNIIAVDIVAGALDSGNADAPLTWRQNGNYSGRNTMTLGIWYEMLLRWVGPAKNVNAISRLTVPYRKNENGEYCNVTVPDHLEIIGEMFNGATMHMRISAALHLDNTGASIYGTQGTLRFANGKLYRAKKDSTQMEEIALTGNDWAVEADFINSIRTGAPVKLTSFGDGIRYMAFTDAVISGSAKRETVAVEVF